MPQKAIHKESIVIVNSRDVTFEELAKNGARNTKVRYLIDERHGSDKFSLRVYAVGKDGCTPLDRHEYEHHMFVLGGQGLLRAEGNDPKLQQLREGDSIFIPSNAVHQFINERDEPLVFLCVKENPKICQRKLPNSELAVEDASRNFC